MKIALVIHGMCCGGAERVMSILAGRWADQGHVVFLITFDNGADPPFYPIPDAVRHIPLGLAGDSNSTPVAVANNWTRVRVLRRTLGRVRPDVVLSFLPATNVLCVLAARSLGIPVVVSERGDPAFNRIGRTWDRLRRFTYLAADRVVVQTASARDFFPAAIRRHTAVIPNPVLKPAPEGPPDPPFPGRPVVVGMGRLHPVKGFDVLLKAMAAIADQRPAWHLAILGEGPQRPVLEALVTELGLQGRVWLPGTVRDPDRYLAQADIFVLSSRTEGFPNALCEAMASGLPVIATDCPSGPRHIVRDGTDGILVPVDDEGALSAALDRLMGDADLRHRLAGRSPEVVERFGLQQVMKQWETVLRQAIDGRAGYRG